MKRILFLTMAVWLLCSGAARAQERMAVQVSVTDTKGEPLPGATILEAGTRNSATADVNGKTTITVPVNATLEVSFIGYATQQVTATRAIIDVQLEESGIALNEVVVTALGIKREKRALSYAMTELKSDAIQQVPTTSLANSLYGKAAGVRIAQTGGGAMGGTKIQIRGVNSLTGSARPLVVLDGIPIYDDESNWAGRERSETQPGSALNDINPEDIESLSILKGANAAALYGSRASNGVILITSKSGRQSQGWGIEVNSAITFDQVAYMPEYQNDFGGGTKGYFDIDSGTGKEKWEWNTIYSFGPRFDNNKKVLWWDGEERPWAAQPDNYRDIYSNGYTNTNSVAISSGNEKNSMRLSYTNYNYKGFLDNMTQHKNQFSFAGSSKLSQYLTVETNVMYSNIADQNPPTRVDRVANFPMPRNEITDLYLDNYKTDDGYFAPSLSGTPMNQISSSVRDNIVNYLIWQQRENRYTKNRDRVTGNIAATLKIIEPLSLRIKAGTDLIFDLKENKEMWRQYSSPTDMNSREGSYRRENWNYSRRFFEGLLSFNQGFGDMWNVSASLGASMEYTDINSLSWSSNGLKVNGVFSTSNNKVTDNQNNAGGNLESELLQSIYGTAQVAYGNYLYLDITGRNDWSSRLPASSRSFFYPSFGLSFMFTDALRDYIPEVLSYGKLRGSYAIVGVTPSNYFANYAYSYGNFDNLYATQSFDGSMPPVGIEPEKTHSWEIGAELRFLNNRLGLDVAYFSNETRNQILSVTVPNSTGASSMRGNAGTMSNYGWEFAFNATPVETKDFRWDATVNFSYTKNELVEFVEGLSSYLIGNPWNVSFVAEPGKPAYAIMLFPFKRDANGNKMVDANGYYMTESKQTYHGDAMPTMLAGLSTSLSYKGFTLSAAIDGQLDGKLISFTNVFLQQTGSGEASLYGRDEANGGLAYWVDATDGNKKKLLSSHSAVAPDASRVYHDGIIADGVKESDGQPNDIILSAYDYYRNRYGKGASEDYMLDNAYIKLREVSLTYQFPKSIYSKLGLQGLSVSAIGSNLCYLYKQLPANINPESTLGTSGANAYVEYTAYPSMRSFGFALKFKF